MTAMTNDDGHENDDDMVHFSIGPAKKKVAGVAYGSASANASMSIKGRYTLTRSSVTQRFRQYHRWRICTENELLVAPRRQRTELQQSSEHKAHADADQCEVQPQLLPHCGRSRYM